MLFLSHKQDESMGSWAVCGVIAVFLSAASEEVFLLDGGSYQFFCEKAVVSFSTPGGDVKHWDNVLKCFEYFRG